jgi:hypothetical protein
MHRPMKPILTLLALIVGATLMALAHGNYVGYSGAPGSSGTCASSCHGSGTGSISFSGVPSSYLPGTIYRIVVRHNGGSTIVNYNASTRVGTGSAVAGSFTAVTNAAVYTTGSETGVHSATTGIDSSVFQWTAPAAGTGSVSFYLAGLQGSKSGSNSSQILTSAEASATGAEPETPPATMALLTNYPNPFNPATMIGFVVPIRGRYSLRVYDLAGQVIETLYDNEANPGVSYEFSFSGSGLSSGVYFAVVQSGSFRMVRKLLLAK